MTCSNPTFLVLQILATPTFRATCHSRTRVNFNGPYLSHLLTDLGRVWSFGTRATPPVPWSTFLNFGLLFKNADTSSTNRMYDEMTKLGILTALAELRSTVKTGSRYLYSFRSYNFLKFHSHVKASKLSKFLHVGYRDIEKRLRRAVHIVWPIN